MNIPAVIESASDAELIAFLEETNAEDYFAESMPYPDQYDEETEEDEYLAEREALESWAHEMKDAL